MQVLQAWLEKVAGICSPQESVGVGKCGSDVGAAAETGAKTEELVSVLEV